MIFIGYQTSSQITITESVENTNETIDSAIAALKTVQSDNSSIISYVIAAGESQENYVIIGYVDP